MNNIFNRIGLLAIMAIVSFSCSKVQYASFGGGPKKLTVLPSQDYYGNLQKETSSPATAAEKKENREIAQTISSLQEKLPVIASGQKMSLVEKVAVARQVNKIQKQLAKNEHASATQKPAESGKNQIVALILALVIGYLGIHRFYLGYTLEGVLQLLTFGGCGIWALIDLIRIAMNDLKPKGGDYEQKL